MTTCNYLPRKKPGLGCSKLMTSFVNVLLKFQTLISSEICQYFFEKMRDAFALQKLLLFCQQNISVFGYKVVKH